jgi:hypothetical protein
MSIAAPTLDQLETGAGRFYEHILLRDADPHETNALTGFYSAISEETGGQGASTTRDWAILSCFMVATTFESIFY